MTTETVVRYRTAYNDIRRMAGEQAAALWLSTGGLSQAEIDRYVARMVPVVRGAQVATSRLVAGYLSRMSLEDTGTRFPYSIDPDEIADLRGVPAATVYARPGVDARTAVKEGKPLQEAMGLGQLRARMLAESDVALAQRASATRAMSADPRIVGYRRVLTGESCAFCATASVQRYRTDQLLPLHAHCDCSVAPIIGTEDPGQTINSQLLDDMKEQGSPQYWKDKGWGVDENGVIRSRQVVPVEGGGTRVTLGDPVKPTVKVHGELGPTLVDPRHVFTGPAAVPA